MDITFIMIVLNGMPFVKHSLESIYDFSDEIIIIEGPVRNLDSGYYDKSGLSTDGTTEFLNNFKDPDSKIKLFRGYFNDKLDMQNLAIKNASFDWVWLIDSDEVYKTNDLTTVKGIISQFPAIRRIDFIPINFWKGFDYFINCDKFHKSQFHYRRVFKKEKDDFFITHRPPTLKSHEEMFFTDSKNFISGDHLLKEGITIYHYSYVDENQVKQKIDLYTKYGWGSNWDIDLSDWFTSFYLEWNPSNREKLEKKYGPWTGDKMSYTSKFIGHHPKVIQSDTNLLNSYEH